MKVDTLHGLPVCERGYLSSRFNENKATYTETTKWHGQHKPYTNDYPSNLVKGVDTNEQ